MILALCGTSEGRELIEKLSKKQLQVLATVTTAYGGKLLKIDLPVEVLEDKLDKEKMTALIEEKKITMIVDVTHPFAENISKLALEISKEKALSYFRYERQETIKEKYQSESILIAEDFHHAADLAKDFDGKIFLTIGSNQLPIFLEKIEANRLVARVLPLWEIIKNCEAYGFTPDNLIAMKGPFNKEINQQMFQSYGASVVVTKDSGSAGGTGEKIAAAEALKIPVILLKRPSISYGETYNNLDNLVNKIASFYEK
ncbi:precorrin-6A/cobalt-precorrin-6A reductase [Natronincola peptidivorans]|uniref:Precorrin-6A/cobalt-precorrin-6A reductase n=1 Tax=Natronincola peptidivorans TaxID=426128 RepID=A0A1I0CW62_9FIRM|nr:cobalt-precorrin-6A reductase [Natronincola peptidivorans]SET23890.1 precorrin-6A/cobalt-precorrin-6A reductase [Natronincola peptidivorans]